MKVILPLARIENAYKRSVDYNPMTEIAGKPIIGHLLDQVAVVNPEELIFIVANYEKEIIDYVKTSCTIPFRFIKQKVVKGSAHAIYGAKHYVKGEVAILFSDTLFDISTVKKSLLKEVDGVIWVSEVSDPRPLGVVFTDGNYASRLIEKPDEPISNLAMIGFYMIKDSQKLFESIKHLIDNNIMTKGEFHLTDALQYMVNSGAKFTLKNSENWVDVDGEGGQLKALELLCQHNQKITGKTNQSVIIPPVYIGKNARITRCVLGPYVSIGEGATVDDSILTKTIIEGGCKVDSVSLASSIIRKNASVKGQTQRVDVAEESFTSVN